MSVCNADPNLPLTLRTIKDNAIRKSNLIDVITEIFR